MASADVSTESIFDLGLDLMRAYFVALLNCPAESAAQHQALLQIVEKTHSENRQLLGWRDAEHVRAQAFCEAVELTPPQIPVGDAQPSDFGAFEAAVGARS